MLMMIIIMTMMTMMITMTNSRMQPDAFLSVLQEGGLPGRRDIERLRDRGEGRGPGGGQPPHLHSPATVRGRQLRLAGKERRV